jgi:hypothetical protein
MIYDKSVLLVSVDLFYHNTLQTLGFLYWRLQDTKTYIGNTDLSYIIYGLVLFYGVYPWVILS